MLWRWELGLGRPPATEKTAGMAVWGVLCLLPCGKLLGCKIDATDLSLRLCPEVMTLRRTGIRKFGTCPFLVDKFCQVTKKKKNPNNWKSLEEVRQKDELQPSSFQPGQITVELCASRVSFILMVPRKYVHPNSRQEVPSLPPTACS